MHCRSCNQATYVTYRAVISTKSTDLSVNLIMEHIQDWRESQGTLLYNMFRLRLASSEECDLITDSDTNCIESDVSD